MNRLLVVHWIPGVHGVCDGCTQQSFHSGLCSWRSCAGHRSYVAAKPGTSRRHRVPTTSTPPPFSPPPTLPDAFRTYETTPPSSDAHADAYTTYAELLVVRLSIVGAFVCGLLSRSSFSGSSIRVYGSCLHHAIATATLPIDGFASAFGIRSTSTC